MPTKRCIKCGSSKPLTKDYFQVRESSKDGFRNECKSCRESYRKQYYEANRERIIKHNSDYRKENWDSFVENRKRYEIDNKEMLKKKRQEYYTRNKERISKRKKEYAERNKERFSRYYLEWARKNVDKCKEKRHRREAKLKQLPATLTVEQWEDIKRHFNHQCAYCGKERELQQEHFIPLSKGGEYTHNNIIPACKSCNCNKRDDDFFEWYPRQPFCSEKRARKILKLLGCNQNRAQQSSIL